jgi:DNA end-binding protein Ku
MAPRAYWKGFLRLSLVSCPIQLFPATSEREKVSFNQINKETGNRIRYRKVDEDTGEEVDSENIVKGYQIAKGQYIEIDDDELESIALESTKTIEIDKFVPKSEIDDLYNMVALGRVVLTSREHVIAMQPRGKGIMGTLLRYPYEVRDEKEYFDDIPNLKIGKDMMDLAKHIVETKSGHFKPEQFEDHYEAALRELIEKKSKGIKIEAPRERAPAKVINLMDALRRSVKEERQPGRKQQAKRSKKRIEGQKEMLFSISGKRAAKEEARKPTPAARRRKAG